MEPLLSIWHQCVASVTDGVITIAIAFVLFSWLERLFSLRPAEKPWRATLLDLQYALLSMLYPPFIYFLMSIGFGWLALQTNGVARAGEMSPLLFAGQLLALLFARDCLIYLRHRIFHTRPVWAFHSIHHSSEEVNWLSAVRFHPAENIIESAGEILLFVACLRLGFDPQVLALGGVVVGFYNLFIHSNLRWTFGPLRYVFVSPVFHRWHHSDTAAAMDKNFAAMFSCLDLAFGTFYLPVNATPDTLGLSASEKTSHPRSLVGQLLHPFRKK